MLKNMTQFEANVQGKIGRFLVESDTAIEAAKEMVFQFQKYLGQIEDAVKAQQEELAKKEAESKVSETQSDAPIEEKIEQIG